MALGLAILAIIGAVVYGMSHVLMVAAGIAGLTALIVTYVVVVGYSVICAIGSGAVFLLSAAVMNSLGVEVGLWPFAFALITMAFSMGIGFKKLILFVKAAFQKKQAE